MTEKSSPVEILRSTTSIDPAHTFEAHVARSVLTSHILETPLETVTPMNPCFSSRVAADVANNNNAVFYGAPSNAGNSACYWVNTAPRP